MDEPGIEIDIAALFEAEPVHGERFSIYVPNRDRNGTLFSQQPWVEEALALLSKIGGGATAMPPVEGGVFAGTTVSIVTVASCICTGAAAEGVAARGAGA